MESKFVDYYGAQNLPLKIALKKIDIALRINASERFSFLSNLRN
jgi:hypothetical protein